MPIVEAKSFKPEGETGNTPKEYAYVKVYDSATKRLRKVLFPTTIVLQTTNNSQGAQAQHRNSEKGRKRYRQRLRYVLREPIVRRVRTAPSPSPTYLKTLTTCSATLILLHLIFLSGCRLRGASPTEKPQFQTCKRPWSDKIGREEAHPTGRSGYR